MKTVNEITEELNNMGSSLADMPRVVPYSVPAGYFGNLSAMILETAVAKNDAVELTPEWGKSTPFVVPEGYFDGLADNILISVKNEQLKSSLPASMPFAVPAGYFDTLPAQMLQAAKKHAPARKKATLIPLSRNSFRQIKIAAAAVLLICIGFGGYEAFYTQPKNSTDKMLSAVPNNEIRDYLQGTYIVDVNRIVNNTDINNIEVDNKDIVQYLNETGWDMTE